MEPSKSRIFFLRDERRFPVACIASNVNENVLSYAVAIHNPKDIYNKKSARKIAEIRLTHPGRYTGTVECADRTTAKFTLMNAIRNHNKMPTRARRAAKLWLKKANEEKTVTGILQ